MRENTIKRGHGREHTGPGIDMADRAGHRSFRRPIQVSDEAKHTVRVVIVYTGIEALCTTRAMI